MTCGFVHDAFTMVDVIYLPYVHIYVDGYQFLSPEFETEVKKYSQCDQRRRENWDFFKFVFVNLEFVPYFTSRTIVRVS